VDRRAFLRISGLGLLTTWLKGRPGREIGEAHPAHPAQTPADAWIGQGWNLIEVKRVAERLPPGEWQVMEF